MIFSSCQRHPLIVVLLDQIRSLHLETHRDDPLLDRAASELRWTLGLLDLFLLPASSVIVVLLDQIRSLHLETHRDDPLLDRAASELRWDARTSNHLRLQRHPLIVVLLDQIRSLSLRRIVMILSLIG